MRVNGRQSAIGARALRVAPPSRISVTRRAGPARARRHHHQWKQKWVADLSVRFTQRLLGAGIAPSTGGRSYDDAQAENLWSTIKIELICWPATAFATRAKAQATLFDYIERMVQPRRIHVGLAGCSPNDFEAAWRARQNNP
jgi:transposase InsO family protein